MTESETSWIDREKMCSSPTEPFQEELREPQWAENVVPPCHKHRTLVLCFDGTGDQFDGDVSSTHLRPRRATNADDLVQNSNVVQFHSMLKKDNKREQMVYYQVTINSKT